MAQAYLKNSCLSGSLQQNQLEKMLSN